MSMESALSYLERMKTDDKFWENHKKLSKRNDRDNQLRKSGYEFTEKELNQALDHLIKKIINGRSN